MKKLKTHKKKVKLTKKEKDEIVKAVNKMSVTFDFIKSDVNNEQWMDTDHAPLYKGLPGGLTFIHTLSLINLTRWLKRLTIVLVVLTIVLILGSIFGWF